MRPLFKTTVFAAKPTALEWAQLVEIGNMVPDATVTDGVIILPGMVVAVNKMGLSGDTLTELIIESHIAELNKVPGPVVMFIK